MCRLYRVLYRLFPLRPFRALLIKKHFLICAQCQLEYGEQEYSALLKTPHWIGKEQSLWPLVRERLSRQKRGERERSLASSFSRIKRWEWAAVPMMILLLTASLIFLRRSYESKMKPEPQPARTVASAPSSLTRVTVTRAELNGQKARPFIYQTSNASFIWFNQAKNIGG